MQGRKPIDHPPQGRLAVVTHRPSLSSNMQGTGQGTDHHQPILITTQHKAMVKTNQAMVKTNQAMVKTNQAMVKTNQAMVKTN